MDELQREVLEAGTVTTLKRQLETCRNRELQMLVDKQKALEYLSRSGSISGEAG